MLSRVAQAPRLATAAARLSRPAASPILRARPAATTISPWVRTYANNQGKPGQQQPPSKPSQSGATSASAQSQSSSSKDAKPSSQPRDDSVGASEEQTSTDASKDAEQIPFHKLPDLTQGIPSTLEQEIRQQSGRERAELEAVDQEDAEGRERRDRRDSYVSTSERNRRWWTRFMLLATAVGSGFGILYMGRDWEDVIEARAPSRRTQRLEPYVVVAAGQGTNGRVCLVLPGPGVLTSCCPTPTLLSSALTRSASAWMTSSSTVNGLESMVGEWPSAPAWTTSFDI